MPDGLITAAEVAKHLGISKRSVYDSTRKGCMPCYRIQRQVRYNIEEVLEALRVQRLPPPPPPNPTLEAEAS